MKWFKHMSASADDEKLAAIIAEGGQAGMAAYGLYWRILEIIASQMEGKTPSCSVSYPSWRWTRELFIGKSYLKSVLSQFKKSGLFAVTLDQSSDDIITISAPNLLKYRDEYSKKSGQAPKNVPPRTEGDTDTDKETDTDTDKETKTKAVSDSRRGEIIETTFSFYCDKIGRDPKKYQLTKQRRDKANSRFTERLKANNGNEAAVEQEFAQAIENLAASEYHTANSYTDWEAQIFKSQDEFEKRLNWKRKGQANGNSKSLLDNFFGNRTEAAKNGSGHDDPDGVKREAGKRASGETVGTSTGPVLV